MASPRSDVEMRYICEPLEVLSSPRLTMSVAGTERFDFVLRLALGSTLAVAGLLKCYDWLTGGSSPAAGWISFVTAEGELLLGGWLLLIGFRPKLVRRLTCLCFAIFACAAAYHYAAGQASCGCFGHLAVAPSYMLFFDFGALLALQVQSAPNFPKTAGALTRSMPLFFACMLALLGAVLIGARMRPVDAVAAGEVSGDAPRILLSSEMGTPFTLATFVDGGRQLLKGRWIVLLHRRDCPRCDAMMPRIVAFAAEQRERRVALIEVPSQAAVGSPAVGLRGDYLDLSLDRSRQWYGETPALIMLRDGLVEGVVTGENLDELRAHKPTGGANIVLRGRSIG